MEPKEFLFAGTLEKWIRAKKSRALFKIKTTHYLVSGADLEGPRIAVDDKGRKVAVEVELPSGQTVVLPL
jgi:hypothetical protein